MRSRRKKRKTQLKFWEMGSKQKRIFLFIKSKIVLFLAHFFCLCRKQVRTGIGKNYEVPVPKS